MRKRTHHMCILLTKNTRGLSTAALPSTQPVWNSPQRSPLRRIRAQAVRAPVRRHHHLVAMRTFPQVLIRRRSWGVRVRRRRVRRIREHRLALISASQTHRGSQRTSAAVMIARRRSGRHAGHSQTTASRKILLSGPGGQNPPRGCPRKSRCQR